MKLSYLVGYGSRYPERVHHRGASIPADVDTGCDGQEWLKTSKPNPNVAAGALVGGPPSKNDSFVDGRENVKQNEATTYNSALLVVLLSSLISSSEVAQSLS
jgi:hypothetical protein